MDTQGGLRATMRRGLVLALALLGKFAGSDGVLLSEPGAVLARLVLRRGVRWFAGRGCPVTGNDACALVAALARPGRSSTDPADHKTLLEIFNQTQGEFWRKETTWTKGILKGLDPCDNPVFFKGLICTGQLLDEGRKVPCRPDFKPYHQPEIK